MIELNGVSSHALGVFRVERSLAAAGQKSLGRFGRVIGEEGFCWEKDWEFRYFLPLRFKIFLARVSKVPAILSMTQNNLEIKFKQPLCRYFLKIKSDLRAKYTLSFVRIFF